MADINRVSGTKTVTSVGPTSIVAPTGSINFQSTATNVSGKLNVVGNTIIDGSLQVSVQGSVDTLVILENQLANVDNPKGYEYDPLNVYSTTAARQQGSVYIPGGLGIEKDLNVGGYIYGRISEANTSMQLVITATNIDQVFFPIFTDKAVGGGVIYADNFGLQGGLTYNPAKGKLSFDRLAVVAFDRSTSPDTGAVVVSGGVGIAGTVNVGEDVKVFGDVIASNLYPNVTDTSIGQVGSEEKSWSEAYVDTLYTKVVASKTGPINVNPASNLFQVNSEIKVTGVNPIGTAPVVTNVLYVTVDGSDTNDGRAMDSSRACRTIGGAINSPYYQSGTQIRVSPGRYLEDNPLLLKPYTSVFGSDLRTTSIEPINKTQDLFHMNGGCYLAFMQFLNGRSGLLKGNYAPGSNRGAYATAFPPLTGTDRIDLFHSPYIQNCTNLTGPWLNDGTMFVPNQTVQVPEAVGTGTWATNTTSIVVSFSTGTVVQGMSINAGQQNPGFFNARTLMLANKPFLQQQVVNYVEKTFNTPFTYDSNKCIRDTGFIVDAIAMDMLYDTTSESVFAGLQYWGQNSGSAGYTGAIASEITATIAAINYVKGLSVAVLNPISSSAANSVGNNFTVITNILTAANFSSISNQIAAAPNGLASTDTAVKSAYAALQSAKASIQAQTITYINSNYPSLTYNRVTCSRDVGYIIDSVSFDLLHGGSKQSIKSGVYYYDYQGTTSLVPNEIPQVTAAYNFIKSILPDVITGTVILSPYQTAITQNVTSPASASAAIVLKNSIDLITNIVRNGPVVVAAKVPMNLTMSTAVDSKRVYDILALNKAYIAAEVISYIDATMGSFSYSKELCFRDVGILVENIGYDTAFGGNTKAIESGLAYYRGVTSVIAGQETQTTSAIDYLSKLCQQVSTNTRCEIIEPSTSKQIINTVLTNGVVASSSLKSLFNIITDIINNGPSAAPKLYNSQGPDAAFISAEILLQANRTFIQEDTINWINNQVFQYPYSEIKCRRDTGIIIDSITADLQYPTPANSQSTFAGLQYWIQDAYVANIAGELTPAIEAITYLSTLAGKIVRNVTPAIDLRVPYSAADQISNLSAATMAESTAIQSGFANILSILNGNHKGWTDRIVANGKSSVLPNVQQAYALLQANKTYFKTEVVAYVNAINPGLAGSYDQVKCARDIGYMVDAVSFDLLHGGNRQSIQSGLAYYGFNGTKSAIKNETTQTVAAFTYLANIVGSIVQNIPVAAKQTQVTQKLDLVAASAVESAALTAIVSTLTNIILNGPGSVVVSPISLVASTAPTVTSAVAIIAENRDFIVEEVITFINDLYNPKPYPYNQTSCRRDAGLIIEAVAADMLYHTSGNSQSTFAGLQYWIQDGYVSNIAAEIVPATDAVSQLAILATKVIENITPAQDGRTVYSSAVQVTSLTTATSAEAADISTNFGHILLILNGNNTGWTDKIVSNGSASIAVNVTTAYNLLQANKAYLTSEVVAYVNTVNPEFVYDQVKCARDIGYMIDAISFDLLHGGNKQSIQSGLAYFGFNGAKSAIKNEITQTVSAFNYISTLIGKIVQNLPVTAKQTAVKQLTTSAVAAGPAEGASAALIISTITNIILNGPANVVLSPISLTASTAAPVVNAVTNILANKSFIVEEVIAFIDNLSKTSSFRYNQEKCYRDTGLIIDAISQDILLGGNLKSLEAGLSYWSAGANYVAGQVTTTTNAINYARDLALQIIANKAAVPQTNTIATQVINTFFQYGGDYMPTQAVKRNFDIITNLIANGPSVAPPAYAGGGLFALNGINGADVRSSPTVASVTKLVGNTYRLGLSAPTIGFGDNSTLYFGKTSVFPLQDAQVKQLSLELTNDESTWDQRKIDAVGGMGGSLVDGAVISSKSPIQSFVYDAFTQITQGGVGIHVTNSGYAQLVSVFTIFCSIAVQVDNGGIASITNSNCNFGDLGLVAAGHGARIFSGTVYNPDNRSYPFSPGIDGLDQYYPQGYWPNRGNVEIFIPDIELRPHISLLMEVIPPKTYRNTLDFAGFLNSSPSTSTLTVGTITLTDIVTTDIAVGNLVYVVDQFNSLVDNVAGSPTQGQRYAPVDTFVVSIGYNSITLNQALTAGGSDLTNPDYFNLYFCGNAYYTVLTSQTATNPNIVNTNILSALDPKNVDQYQGPAIDQIQTHIQSLTYLHDTLISKIIKNTSVVSLQSTVNNTPIVQTVYPQIIGGGDSATFISNRFNDMLGIIGAADITAAKRVVMPARISKTGNTVSGAGSAISLITANIDFMAAEIYAYVKSYNPGLTYNIAKCHRDVALILQNLIYDLETGGNYNSTYVGLSYWSRDGTHHIVELGENVSDTSLFPDGATVNFYQRSYISASGYLFEYVGAGSNYGALPQIGVADPQQSRETVQVDYGKVFFTSTDQNGDFRIGPGLVVSQASGVLSGRTFTQSLFANMTPFILAIEG